MTWLSTCPTPRMNTSSVVLELPNGTIFGKLYHLSKAELALVTELMEGMTGIGDLLVFLRDLIAYGPECHEAEETERITRLLQTRFADAREAPVAVCRHACEVAPADARPLVEFCAGARYGSNSSCKRLWAARRDNRIRIA